MKKKATIYDIAREANVSIATVTRVMAGHPSVRPATRQKVQQVIDAHGYTPSTAARDLENGRTKTFGIILPEITNPILPRSSRARMTRRAETAIPFGCTSCPATRPSKTRWSTS